MKLMVQSWDEDTNSYNDEFEESAFLDFSIEQEPNRPAMATIFLADPTGSIMQKYDVDTTAHEIYIGPGKVTIEYPDATDVFYGRIVKARHDREKCRTYLLCRDWMHQLDDEVITYDFREDLGSGLRQSGLKSATDGFVTSSLTPTYTSGANYYMYDDDMSWTDDEFNGMYVVLPIDHVGQQTVNIGPYGYVLTDEAGGAATDDGNFRNTWIGDGSVHETSQDAAAWWSVAYYFRMKASEGSLYNSVITGARAIIEASLENSGANDYTGRNEATVTIRCAGAIFYWHGIPDDDEGNATIKKYTVEMPKDYVDTLLPLTDDVARVEIAVFGTSSGAGTTLQVDSIRFEYDIETTGHSSLITITDTQRSLETGITKAFRHDASVGYTDCTTDLNDAGVGDVALLPDPLGQNDAFYFGLEGKTRGICLQISQAGTYDGSASWQYWSGAAWANLTDVVDATNAFEAAAGTHEVTWTIPADWAQNDVNGTTKYWVRLWVWSGAPSITVVPLATQGWSYTITCNRLLVDTDLDTSGLGLWEDCQYCIAKPIYKHIDSAEGGTLVTGGDPLVTLTAAAGVGHTSGVSTRKHENRTRLVILQDTAEDDQALFWVTLGTATFNWKQNFNGAGTAITDADVLFWVSGEWDYEPMKNTYKVYGIRVGDTQVYATDTDATSIDTYGNVTRSAAITNTGLMSNRDATALAGALVDRDKDVKLYLGAVFKGFSAYRFGDELKITSTQLGLTDAVYVITQWKFDLSTWRTTVRLHPQSTVGYVPHSMYGEDIRQTLEQSKKIAVDQYPPNTTTQVLT